MDSQAFAEIVMRGIALQFVLGAMIIGGTLLCGKILATFVAKPDDSLDGKYFVVVDAGGGMLAMIAAVLCLILGAALFYWSAPLARFLAKGVQ